MKKYAPKEKNQIHKNIHIKAYIYTLKNIYIYTYQRSILRRYRFEGRITSEFIEEKMRFLS